MTVPAELDGHVVTVIGDNAFAFCTELTRLTVTNALIHIGNRAFFNCSALESVALPASFQGFGTEVFDGCAALTNVLIETGENQQFFTTNGLVCAQSPEGPVVLFCPPGLSSVTIPPGCRQHRPRGV